MFPPSFFFPLFPSPGGGLNSNDSFELKFSGPRPGRHAGRPPFLPAATSSSSSCSSSSPARSCGPHLPSPPPPSPPPQGLSVPIHSPSSLSPLSPPDCFSLGGGGGGTTFSSAPPPLSGAALRTTRPPHLPFPSASQSWERGPSSSPLWLFSGSR